MTTNVSSQPKCIRQKAAPLKAANGTGPTPNGFANPSTSPANALRTKPRHHSKAPSEGESKNKFSDYHCLQKLQIHVKPKTAYHSNKTTPPKPTKPTENKKKQLKIKENTPPKTTNRLQTTKLPKLSSEKPLQKPGSLPTQTNETGAGYAGERLGECLPDVRHRRLREAVREPGERCFGGWKKWVVLGDFVLCVFFLVFERVFVNVYRFASILFWFPNLMRNFVPFCLLSCGCFVWIWVDCVSEIFWVDIWFDVWFWYLHITRSGLLCLLLRASLSSCFPEWWRWLFGALHGMFSFLSLWEQVRCQVAC